MPPPMDLAYLERLCKGKRSRMAEYITLYLQEAPGLFAHLETMLKANDDAGLAQAAHALFPHVHYMGHAQLCASLKRLQELANTEGAAACGTAVQECLVLNGKLNKALQNWLDPDYAVELRSEG